jgi:hypothetical protein
MKNKNHKFNTILLKVGICSVQDAAEHFRRLQYQKVGSFIFTPMETSNFRPEHPPASISNGTVYVDGAGRTAVISAVLNRGVLLQE